MDKKQIRGAFARGFYNSSETFARVLISRKPSEETIRQRHIAYGKGKYNNLNLLYNNDDKQKPLMLYVHGGGFVSGVVNMRDTYCENFVKQGFAVANVDYTPAPIQKFPYQIQELLDAIDFLFDNKDTYHIDTTKILLAGESAGGYFITYLATLANHPEILKKLNLTFNHQNEFKVTALLSNCGAIDLVRLCDSKFPDMKFMVESFSGKKCKYIKANANNDEITIMAPILDDKFPPTVFLYGKHDPLSIESLECAKMLKQAGVPYLLYLCDGSISMHAWAIATCLKKGKDCLTACLEFLLPYFK